MLYLDTFYRRVCRDDFLDTLAAAKRERGDHGLCVSEPAEGAALYISGDGQSGYALNGGDLGSVFSLAKGRLAGIIEDAMRRADAAREPNLRIDCFEPLAAVYARHGFRRVSSLAFDWQYAPDGWEPRHGEPDVIFMSMPVDGLIAA